MFRVCIVFRAHFDLVAAVSTPWGHRSASCVVTVPEGAVVLEDGSLQHPDGLIEKVEVAEECHTDEVMQRHAERRGNLGEDMTTDGWLDNKGYTYNSGFSRFTGHWNVPEDPPSPQQPETLYWFFGMENLAGGPVSILQPVLTWGDESEGASGGWSVWSWACCPSSITYNSKNIGGLKSGMQIDGLIEADGGNWKIDTAFTDESGQRQNTTLIAYQPYAYTWADVTLEVYNVTRCSMHSPGKVTFEELNLFGASGTELTPAWSGADYSSCGGVVNVMDSKTISIQHSTSDEIAV